MKTPLPDRTCNGHLFRHCPECATPVSGPPQGPALLFACATCGFEMFLNVASAAGAFIEDPEGRILFIRRAKDPAKGKLGLPGGFVDPGETAEEAVRREVREEVGLEIGDLRFVCSRPNRYRYKGILYHTVDLFFASRAESLEPTVASPEVEHACILSADAVRLEDLAFDSMREALAAFRKLKEQG